MCFELLAEIPEPYLLFWLDDSLVHKLLRTPIPDSFEYFETVGRSEVEMQARKSSIAVF
jgi:hypothetical protein